jgi:hypothetical protein
MHEELLVFDSAFSALLSQSRAKDLQQTQLVNINAALSRLTSQTYSGISPILETECHFFTHSLLAVGTATMAIANFRRFIEDRVHESRLIGRLKCLAKQPPWTFDLMSLGTAHEFWDREHLFAAEIDELLEESPPTARMPTITYFSGRDGFRSTRLALSAPLEVLTGANSRTWSVLTLTHELCHILVDAVLGTLFPSATDSGLNAKRAELCLSTARPRSRLEQLQRFLLQGLLMLNISGTTTQITAASVSQIGRASCRERVS